VRQVIGGRIYSCSATVLTSDAVNRIADACENLTAD